MQSCKSRYSCIEKGVKVYPLGSASNHRGSRSGLGNHRGSNFRLLAGVSLANRNNIPLPTRWGDKKARRKKRVN